MKLAVRRYVRTRMGNDAQPAPDRRARLPAWPWLRTTLRLIETELKLLFRARVVLLLVVAEVYLCVFIWSVEDYGEGYVETVYRFANIVPWALVGMVMAAEVALGDAQCGVRAAISRLANPIAVYVRRLLLVAVFSMLGALSTNQLVTWIVVPVSTQEMLARLASPLILSISAGFLTGVRFRTESAALLAGVSLMVPVMGDVLGGEADRQGLDRLLRESALILVAVTLLLFAGTSLRRQRLVGGE
ncbi:MAG: hypothetical protein AB1714_24455 [Acidobacteriota bacterium]